MTKTVFVIMPFVQANERDQASLTRFFNDYIKRPIERDPELTGRFAVERSADAFLILDQILSDIASADYVICDLSGPAANPNVMFELGVRLSVSHKPTILIREEYANNKAIFDVSGLYTHPYKLTETRQLEEFLVEKIKGYELGSDQYNSPVLKVLNHDAAFWMQLPINKACAFLGGISSACEAYLRAFSRALTVHVTKTTGDAFIVDSPDKCYLAFKQLQGKEEVLDSFTYSITSIPSLDSYLSSIYLLGLVEDDIEREFRSCAMAYSLHFNKGNSAAFWTSRFEEYVAYAFETLILMNLCRLIIKILRSRPGTPERKMLIESFHADRKKSHL